MAEDRRKEGKGARTRRHIMAAAQDMLEDMSIEAISQEAIAQRVGITQSALRHHFPTKEGLFDAIFEAVFQGFYAAAERIGAEPDIDPRQQLQQLCALHIDYVLAQSDKVTLGSFAHYLHNQDLLKRQSAWYHWIVDRYAGLVAQIRPDLDKAQSRACGFAMLTLCIGAWVTIGRTRPPWPGLTRDEARAALITAVMQMIDQDPIAKPL